ncbi:polymer-forming cytoskeletal protein [Lysobacter cavernae]|uniref:Polymer-forming cytoskeletal protein n=1 Tax=Lysobacter cavernae TaxID=1685901 RepID=A0ABV7RRV0_9GAMM
MAIFNQPTTPKRETPFPSQQPETALKKEPDTHNEISFGTPATPAPAAATPVAAAPKPVERDNGKESLIASDLSIEGKIQGSGHIRIAGRFKGDVHVEGDLTVEVGAKLNGGVRARKVVIAGELEGNIESANRVELLEGGLIVGDVKAGTVIVAAGSRMRGQVEFGWEDKEVHKPNGKADSAKNDHAKAEASATS